MITNYYSQLSSVTDLSKSLQSVGSNSLSDTRNPTAPNHSQHQKTVLLQLYTDGKIDGNLASDNEFIFPINPEDFSVNYQHRIQVIQTLGDPFIDEFGVGVPTLNMRGTTGWRTRPNIQNIDGHEAFKKLRRDFINKYFDLRLDRHNSNQDPDDIMLVVINSVDDLAYQIVPVDFKLLRNKSRPLLYQYDLTFKVVADLSDLSRAQVPTSANTIKSENWLDALETRVSSLVEKVTAFASPVCQAVGAFLENTVSILVAAKTGVGAVASLISGVIGAIESVLDAVQDTEAFIDDLFLEAIVELNNLTSIIGEFNCYLSSASSDYFIPDFSGVQGITDCAATHGIEAGEQAASASNALEWVDEVNELARQNGSNSLIATSYTTNNLTDIFEKADAAVVVSSDLDANLTELTNIARDTSTAGSLDEVYTAITDTLSNITFDVDKVPDDDVAEDLTEITRYKSVTVKENQSLMDIAYQEYGDADRWTDIAAANDIMIENCAENMAPYTTFLISSTLYTGQTSMDLGYDVPTEFAVQGCTLKMKDKEGHRQTVQVESIDGNRINFYETISRNMIGPIWVIRYVNLAEYGVSIGTTQLTKTVNPGLKTYYLNEIKDIYPGYVLFISGGTEARAYTVESVNYLEKYVVLLEPSVGFTAKARVEIFNTETNMVHLTPGTTLEIPVMSGDNAGTAQNENEIYGGDLTLDSQGLLSISNGDIVLSSGLDNLNQSILHRIASEYASLVIHPTYGCGLLTIIGKKNTPATKTLARAALVEALQREPRIDKVSELNVVTKGDIIQFSVKVESVGNNTKTDLNFVIGV